MNKQNSSAQQQDVNTCNAKPHSYGPCTAASVIEFLWSRADGLSADELKFVAQSTEYASHMADALADTVSHVGCLIDADDTPGQMRSGNFEIGGNVARLLFTIADQVRVIGALANIGSEAEFTLRNREGSHV